MPIRSAISLSLLRHLWISPGVDRELKDRRTDVDAAAIVSLPTTCDHTSSHQFMPELSGRRSTGLAPPILFIGGLGCRLSDQLGFDRVSTLPVRIL